MDAKRGRQLRTSFVRIMVVELPADVRQQEKITAWLKTSGITYNEEA